MRRRTSRRIRGSSPADRGAPGWMVTFGDMMTLLLTFFVMLFSISEIKQNKLYELMHSFRQHFQIATAHAGFAPLEMAAVPVLGTETDALHPEDGDGEPGRADVPAEEAYGEFTHVSRIEEQVRISIEGRVLFEAGSSELAETGRRVLARVRERLAGTSNRIHVVGHTAPGPLPAGAGDHEELGFRRARAVKAILTAGSRGVRPERVRVSSDGDHHPLPGVDLFDPDDRARLRRVDIIRESGESGPDGRRSEELVSLIHLEAEQIVGRDEDGPGSPGTRPRPTRTAVLIGTLVVVEAVALFLGFEFFRASPGRATGEEGETLLAPEAFAGQLEGAHFLEVGPVTLLEESGFPRNPGRRHAFSFEVYFEPEAYQEFTAAARKNPSALTLLRRVLEREIEAWLLEIGAPALTEPEIGRRLDADLKDHLHDRLPALRHRITHVFKTDHSILRY